MLTASLSHEARPRPTPTPSPNSSQQLGSDQYAVRRRAEEELTRLGPDAFDQLKLAEQSNDLEVAERASYIVQSMRVEWIRPRTPPRSAARRSPVRRPVA